MKLILFLQQLTAMRLLLLSVGISIVMSEVLVCGMGMLLKGEITYDYLLTGFVTSLCVATVMEAGLVFFLNQQRLAADALEVSTQRYRALARQLERLNEGLAQHIAEEVAKNREKDRLMLQQSRLAAMGEMIGNIAHQWRQPLNALGLLISNIKDAYEYNELDKATLDKSVEDGKRMIQKMSTTIDDFRNFFKPSTEKKRFRMCDGAEEAVELVTGSFKNQNIEIINESCSDPCFVYGYPNEYSQVVLNALTNAKDAIVGKGVAGKIRNRIEMRGEFAVLSVQDNGGGIPEEIVDKVFDPYFTTKEKGTGIGLYMSKMIMEKMGGNITIRNIEGGAEVLICLPLAGDSAFSSCACVSSTP